MKSNYFTIVISLLIFFFPKDSYSQTTQNKSRNAIDSIKDRIAQQSLVPNIFNDYHELGKQYFLQQSSKKNYLDSAIKYTLKAYQLKKQLLHEESDSLQKRSLQKSLYNLAYFKDKRKDFHDAIKYYLTFVKEEKKITSKLIFTYYQLGDNYKKIGDFHKSLTYFNKIISLSENKIVNHIDVIDSYTEIADIYALMGYSSYKDEIIKNLNFAEDLILKHTSDKQTFHFERKRINQIQGNLFYNLKNYPIAIEHFKKVINQSQKNDSIVLAKAHNSLGISLLKSKNKDTAFINLHKSIAYDPEYIDPYHNLGDYYVDNYDFEKALKHYHKAIIYSFDKKSTIPYGQLPTLEDIEISSDKISLLNHIVTKANAWVKFYEYNNNKNHLHHALETFKLADQLIDIIRFQTVYKGYKSMLFIGYVSRSVLLYGAQQSPTIARGYYQWKSQRNFKITSWGGSKRIYVEKRYSFGRKPIAKR